MPKLSTEEIEGVLSGGRAGDGAQNGLLRIGTIGEDGWPSVVPVGFAYQDRTIYITARERDIWLANLRRDPRCCISVDDNDYFRRKVTIKGTAEIRFEPGQDDEWRDLRRPIRSPDWRGATVLPDGREEWLWAEAYSNMTWDEPRALVAIDVAKSRVTSWRMPAVGEYLHQAWSASYFQGPVRKFVVTEIEPVAKVVSADA